jgi:glutamyl-tRNA reductase
MSIQLVGMNHRTAPVEVRERLALSDDGAAWLAQELTRGQALEEALVLSTCNRVEFLASGRRHALRGEVFRCIRESLNGASLDEGAFYDYDERGAVRHVFRVAASLDSMVVGEPQILGQVKDAYQRARDAGTLGGPLDRLVTHAFHVARRVRNETEIGKLAVSVSYVAVELARKIFGDLEGLSVLLIGAGEMAEAAARHLRGAGATHLWVTNRTAAGAERLAGAFGAEPARFDRLLELLQRVDIVLSSTGAPGYILSKRTAQGVIAARRNRPIFLVDIAVPRDIDPDINEVDNMFVYDIDDLQQVAAANMKHRRHEADIAERIVEDEVERILRRLQAHRATPAIISLNERLEVIRQGELQRYRSKLQGLTGDQREAVEALTRGIINKVAHHPIREAKRSAADPRSRVTVEDFRRIFGLD